MDVDVERAIPGFGSEFEETAVDGTAGGVDEDIDGAEFGDRAFDGGARDFGVAHVGSDEKRFAAEFFDGGFGGFCFGVVAATDNRNASARFGKREGGCGADAASAAGDQTDF